MKKLLFLNLLSIFITLFLIKNTQFFIFNSLLDIVILFDIIIFSLEFIFKIKTIEVKKFFTYSAYFKLFLIFIVSFKQIHLNFILVNLLITFISIYTAKNFAFKLKYKYENENKINKNNFYAIYLTSINNFLLFFSSIVLNKLN